MKKHFIAAAISSAALATPAFAQSDHFKGLSLGLGVNIANTTAEIASFNQSINGSASDTDTNLAVQLQYNIALSQAWVMGLGGTTSIGDLKAGSFGGNAIKIKNNFSLYVAPGYVFSNGLMGYAKFAYINADTSASGFKSTTFDGGYGYGLGVQAMLNPHWFGQLELMFNNYSDRSFINETDKLKSNALTLTAGYKF